ncbi:WAT1-related protein At1g25270-like isoform X1 [Apium graveolens]|uniref:WAT1-related protein At1g25270-like isoform X1 n=1 Tax=Apium graveolens TaxID=4045 RepID=UPI003D7BDACF
MLQGFNINVFFHLPNVLPNSQNWRVHLLLCRRQRPIYKCHTKGQGGSLVYPCYTQGMLASGMMFTFIAWCIRMRGPLFVSILNPLMLVLMVIAGSLVLNEHLHLGSVLGALTIVCGLYAVLWGEGKEIKRIAQLMPEVSSRDTAKPIDIVIISSSGASENQKNVVRDNNNTSEASTIHSPANSNEMN